MKIENNPYTTTTTSIPQTIDDEIITSGQPKVEAQPAEQSEDSGQLSALSQFVYSHEITDFRYSSDETIIGYRSKDNGMALRAHSQFDFHLQQETISLDVTYTAEALGLTAKDFEQTGGKPMELSFSFMQEETRLEYKSSTELMQQLRKPEDILRDLSNALVDALRDKSNRAVSLRLDDEALKTLMSDERFGKLYKEIILLISYINMLKRMQGGKGQQEVRISGKGDPILNIDEKLSVDSKVTSINFKLTVLPPGSKISSNDGSNSLPQESDPTLQSNQNTNLDVAV